jgi:hypothetical protein
MGFSSYFCRNIWRLIIITPNPRGHPKKGQQLVKLKKFPRKTSLNFLIKTRRRKIFDILKLNLSTHKRVMKRSEVP